jgi:CHAT domain-containing protein
VLSACRARHAVTRPGNEPLGFAAALLALGTRTLIAPTVEVPDAEPTRRLLTGFHRGLAAGQRPSVALARARAVMDLDDHLDLAAAASFACIGADDPV